MKCRNAILAVLLGLLLAPTALNAHQNREQDTDSTPSAVLRELHLQPGPHASLRFSDDQELPTALLFDQSLKGRFASAPAPLSLAAGDLDGDGVSDLVVGYGTDQGGVLSIYRGNIYAIFPKAPGAEKSRSAGIDPDQPFLSPARVIPGPSRPDFLALGDFNADGSTDVLIASVGGHAIYLLPGDGRGRLGATQKMDMGASISALITGEIHRRDGLDDIIVATTAGGASYLKVFASPHGAWTTKSQNVDLPSPATQLSLGQLDDQPPMDVAIVADGRLFLLYGQDRRQDFMPSKTQEIDTGFPAASVFISSPSFPNGPFPEMMVLGEDGKLWKLDRNTTGPDFEGAPSHRSRKRPGSWQLAGPLECNLEKPESQPTTNPLLTAKLGIGAGRNLLILDRAGAGLTLLTHDDHGPNSRAKELSKPPSARDLSILSRRETESYAEGEASSFERSSSPVFIHAPGSPVAASSLIASVLTATLSSGTLETTL